MNVRVRIKFERLTQEDWEAMRSLAKSLTNDPKSVNVFADDKPAWLVAEFTVPTEAQLHAVSKIDREMRFHCDNREDSTIQFPRTEEEQAHAERKAAQRKARRRAV